jgi:hypothetical protein
VRPYHSGENECPIVHCRVQREIFDDTVKELINPERHRIDEDENGQLDADQNREKVLYEMSIHLVRRQH